MKTALILACVVVSLSLASCSHPTEPPTFDFTPTPLPYDVKSVDTYWARAYNSASDLNCVVLVGDNVAVSGWQVANKNQSYCALLNRDGAPIWEQYGNPGGPAFGASIAQLKDGRLISGGLYDEYHFALFVVNADSVVEFGSFPRDINNWYSTSALVPTDDGGIIVEGSAQHIYNFPAAFAAKFSSTGALLWKVDLPTQLPSGSASEFAPSVGAGGAVLASDGSGDVLVADGEDAMSPYRGWLGVSRIASDGSIKWRKLYDVNATAPGLAIVPVSGGYIVSGGEHRQFDSLDGATLVKIDQDGNQLWKEAVQYTYFFPNPMIAESDGVSFMCENRLLHVDADGKTEYAASAVPYDDRWQAERMVGTSDGSLLFAGRDNAYAGRDCHATLRKIHLKD